MWPAARAPGPVVSAVYGRRSSTPTSSTSSSTWSTLAIVGSPVEAELGKGRFIVVYLLSALGGSVASYLLSSANELGLGASGAIFGLMGAYFVLARRRGWEVGTILALIVINLVIGFASTTIDWRAHLGGMITGAVVTMGLARSADAAPDRRSGRRGGDGAVTSVAAVAVLAALTLLPPGPRQPVSAASETSADVRATAPSTPPVRAARKPTSWPRPRPTAQAAGRRDRGDARRRVRGGRRRPSSSPRCGR